MLAPETETDVAIARRLSRNGALVIDNQRLRNLDALRRFYAERGFDPVWTDTAGAAPAADGLVTLLRAADQEGLDPLHYHADAIERRVGSADVKVQAELDLLIADAVMEYAIDLRAGRLTPRSIAPELAAVPPPLDPVEIAKQGRDQSNLAAFLSGFTPPHPQYAALRDALRRYRAIAAAGGWPAAGQGPVLKPGMQDMSVPALRRRLAATGDYTAKDMASTVYDAPLQAAVKRFQSYNGQTADGVLGELTRVALNISAAERVNQIIANMERWRWMPDDLGRAICHGEHSRLSLKAMDKGEVALRMPVIVGSVERPTPVFSHRITHLVFNPTWTIPPTVARNDILPKLLRNPAYLKEHDIKLFDSWAPGARPIDSAFRELA